MQSGALAHGFCARKSEVERDSLWRAFSSAAKSDCERAHYNERAERSKCNSAIAQCVQCVQCNRAIVLQCRGEQSDSSERARIVQTLARESVCRELQKRRRERASAADSFAARKALSRSPSQYAVAHCIGQMFVVVVVVGGPNFAAQTKPAASPLAAAAAAKVVVVEEFYFAY